MRFLIIALAALALLIAPTVSFYGSDAPSTAYADGKDRAAKEMQKLREERDKKIRKAEEEYQRDMKKAEKEGEREKIEKARKKYDEKVRNPRQVLKASTMRSRISR